MPLDLAAVPIRPPVDDETVSRLRDLLARAESGEIVSVVYAATTRRGTVVTAAMGRYKLAATLGAMLLLQHDLCADARVLDESEPDDAS